MKGFGRVAAKHEHSGGEGALEESFVKRPACERLRGEGKGGGGDAE
jgi:hypothetical protein